MKKIFAFIFILNFVAFNLFAQDAQNILEKAASKVQSAKGINVSFILTQKDKLGHTLGSSKGILKIKGTKYYVNQDGSEIYCNGAQIWNYDGQGEVTVAKAEYDDDEFSPQQIITGFNNKDFTATLIASGSAIYQIQLVPVDKRKNIKQIILFINKANNLITKAVVTDKPGNITEISFGNASFNVVIPDSQFVFDASKHPGVEVVNQ
ncbi:MAG: outer membrane lipoprotein carrier protein LolA [Bacteroidetes bacterium]|nr:outer membrane lipoprotein carrier protein LolA [Bacteroidota bacterium]